MAVVGAFQFENRCVFAVVGMCSGGIVMRGGYEKC